MTKPGDRVGAICGGLKEVVEFFGYGVYMGDEPIPVGDIGPFGLPAEEGDPPNPKIFLDSGEIVWGCQCWWGAEAEIKKRLEGENVVMVKVADKLAKWSVANG